MLVTHERRSHYCVDNHNRQSAPAFVFFLDSPLHLSNENARLSIINIDDEIFSDISAMYNAIIASREAKALSSRDLLLPTALIFDDSAPSMDGLRVSAKPVGYLLVVRCYLTYVSCVCLEYIISI